MCQTTLFHDGPFAMVLGFSFSPPMYWAFMAGFYLLIIIGVTLVQVLVKLFRWISTILTRPEDDAVLNTPSHFVILVHGTWARNAQWTQQGSAVRECITDTLGSNVQFRKFMWSGRNRFGARSKAAMDLATLIEQTSKTFPTVPVLIISHSHGGQVALQAISRLPQTCQVNALIFLSTPFLVVESRELGEASGIAAWAVPAAFAYILGMIVIGGMSEIGHWFTMNHPAVIGVSWLIAAVALGIYMSHRAVASAKEINEAHTYAIPSHTKLLLMRAPGDEASTGINVISILTHMIERVYLAVQNTLQETLGLLSAFRRFLGRNKGAAAAVCILSFFAGLKFPFSSVALTLSLWLIPCVVVTVAIEGGFGFKIVRFAYAVMSYASLALPLALFSVLIGPELALSALFINVSAESAPLGQFEISILPTKHGTSWLKHSRPYEAPAAMGCLKRWVSNNVEGCLCHPE